MPIVFVLIGVYLVGVVITSWRIFRLHNEFGLPTSWLYFGLLWPIQHRYLPHLTALSNDRPQLPRRNATITAQSFTPWLLVGFPSHIGESIDKIKLLHWLDENQEYWFVSSSVKQVSRRQYISIPISYNEPKQWASLIYDKSEMTWKLHDLKAPLILNYPRKNQVSGELYTPPRHRIHLHDGAQWVLHNSEFQLIHLAAILAVDSKGISRDILLGRPGTIEFNNDGWWTYHQENRPLVHPNNHRLIITSDLRIHTQNLTNTIARFETPWTGNNNSVQPHLIPGAKLYLPGGITISFSKWVAVERIKR